MTETVLNDPGATMAPINDGIELKPGGKRIAVMCSGALPLLWNATDFGADDALTATVPKSTDDGSWHTYGALTPDGSP